MNNQLVRYPEYEELLEQHLHLETMLQHLHHSAKADVKPSVFLEELKHVRKRIQSHFAFEELGGYLHAALENANHLKGTAATLLQEHTSLLQEWEKLIAEMERCSGDQHLSEDFVRELDALLRRLQQHEHRENELVQRAANEEVSAID